jgi:hypothetical protein
MLTRQGAEKNFQAEFQRLADIVIDSTDSINFTPTTYRPLEFVMAEKTVATIISKTLEHTPKYSGKSEQDADEWLKDLNSNFRMAEITELQALKIIGNFLDGPTKQWYDENRSSFETWNHFKTEFIKTYSSPAKKQLASHRLRTRQQRVDEPIIEYYTDVIKLCKIVDPHMTDVSKIDHLYHGLKMSLMREVLRQEPSTPAEFLEHATREEVLDHIINTSLITGTHEDKNVMHSSASYLSTPTQIAAVTASSRYYPQDSRQDLQHPRHQGRHDSPNYHNMAFRPPHTASNNSFRPHTPRCYNCNKPGHFARDCWSSKNSYGGLMMVVPPVFEIHHTLFVLIIVHIHLSVPQALHHRYIYIIYTHLQFHYYPLCMLTIIHIHLAIVLRPVPIDSFLQHHY